MIVIVAMCVAVLFETVLLLLLLRALDELRNRGSQASAQQAQYPDMGGLTVGEEAPAFVARDRNSRIVSLEDFQADRLVLAFVSPGCSACKGATTALNKLAMTHPWFTVVFVGESDSLLNQTYADEFDANAPFLTPEANAVRQLYKVPMVPFVFILNETRTILARGVVNNEEHLQLLLATADLALQVIR